MRKKKNILMLPLRELRNRVKKMIPKFRVWDTYEKEMLENVTPLFDDSNSMMAIITDF